jgi:hypothetical protein
MRKTLLAALAVAAIVSGTILANRAEAMTTATPAALGVAAVDTGMIREAAIVCGTNGCAPVQTKLLQRRKFHPLGHR